MKDKISKCPSCRGPLDRGFALKTAGLSFVQPGKFKKFAFVDEDLQGTGFLAKLLPSRARYSTSYLCRQCQVAWSITARLYPGETPTKPPVHWRPSKFEFTGRMRRVTRHLLTDPALLSGVRAPSNHNKNLKAMIPPETVVQRQLNSYNTRDVEAWLATYAADSQQFDAPT